jgi:hypothetical protein
MDFEKDMSVSGAPAMTRKLLWLHKLCVTQEQYSTFYCQQTA